jgi:hypothetical protein
MLWFLRKVFGAIALAWVALLLLCWASCLVNPKAAGMLLAALFFVNYVGIPASVFWTVLKVISVLSAPRVEQPATVAASYPPSQIPAREALRLATPAAPAQAERAAPAIRPSAAEPDVYTYSAPGMPMCPTCGRRPAIFYCSTHQTAVCLECVAGHDEPTQCAYVPAFRAPKPATGQATTSGPATPPSAAKPASILGIG